MLRNLFSRGPHTGEAEPSSNRPEKAQSRTYTVGWLLNTQKTSIIWDSPKPVRIESQSTAPRSVAQCPSVLDFDRRHFSVACPIDLHLRVNVNAGGVDVTDLLAETSPMRPGSLQKWIVFQPRDEWRHPQRPVLQILTSYHFVSDDPVYINQYPPVLDYTGDTRPGIQINGRFPIDVWPRALMWAFEWHDTKKDLILRRGEPLFYVRFEGPDPAASVRLVEAQKTPELVDYIASITGVTEFVGQTYSLFKTAAERRPEKLLFPRK